MSAAVSIGVLLVAAAVWSRLGTSSDLDALRHSQGAGLLPPGALVSQERHAARQQVMRNPAFLRVTARTTGTADAVRRFYRSALTTRGFVAELSPGHPFAETDDAYRRGRVIARVDVPVSAGSPFTFTYELSMAR